NRQQALDLARVDLPEDLVRVDARSRQILFVDPPDAGDVAAMIRVADIAPAGELVALLPVLAPTLTVGLSRNRAVPALRFPESAGGEHEVDRAQRVLDAVRVVLDSPRMKQEAGFRGAPPFRRLPDGAFRYTGDLGGSFDRPLPAVHGHFVEPDGQP